MEATAAVGKKEVVGSGWVGVVCIVRAVRAVGVAWVIDNSSIWVKDMSWDEMMQLDITDLGD